MDTTEAADLARTILEDTETDPYLVSVEELDELFYDLGRQKNVEAAARWKHAVDTNEWPGYQGINRVLAPTWALDELEEEIY